MAKKRLNTMGDLFGQGLNENSELETELISNVDNDCKDGTIEIPVTEFESFKNHPFHVIDDDDMDDLVESIKERGVLNPILCRPLPSGGFEIISGHRRIHAATIAGLKNVPAVVMNVDDDEAAIIMVDSNIQRTKLLPSEKAFAYKIKMDALKRQGKKSENGETYNTASEIGKENKDSIRQVFRYIKLTKLNKELLDLVDEGKIPVFSVGEPLAALTETEQNVVIEFYNVHNILPNSAQAIRVKEKAIELRKNGSELNSMELSLILRNEKPKSVKVVLQQKKLQEYFPIGTSEKKMEDVILGLLERWKEENSSEE